MCFYVSISHVTVHKQL